MRKMPKDPTNLAAEGLTLPESPRWRDGRLWFSDLFTARVMTIDLEGRMETVAALAEEPSAIGFLDDSRTLLLLRASQRLVVLGEDGELTPHADLTVLGGDHVNDMVVQPDGTAYVGMRARSPHDPSARRQFGNDAVVRVAPDGTAQIAARGISFPNGLAITNDGATLVVAETFSRRLIGFSIAGAILADQRTLATYDSARPDGLCLDEDGGTWIAALDDGYIRATADGTITDVIDVEPGVFAMACVLGGPDRRTLFMLSSRTSIEDIRDRKGDGTIDVVEVATAGAGLP